MTINGPAPSILAMFLNVAADQHVDGAEARAGRALAGDERAAVRRGGARDRPRHGPGRHPEGGPGSEHLHPVDRVRPQDDGRRPAVLRRPQGAELLLGLHLGVPHRRGRGEPDHPARAHAVERVHLRRVVARARDGRRGLRPLALVLLLERHGRGVHRARSCRAAHLGGRHAGPLRGLGARPEAEVPRADLGQVAARPGDVVQRHPHDPPGALRDLRQLQLAAHQRLRRGRDHPDGRVGPPGDGDPAHHQPRVGPRRLRQPAPGQLRRRRAHRPRRGGRAQRVRADQRARRGARRDGARLPARAHPGRVHGLRAAQARRVPAHRGREHVPRPGPRPRPRLDRARPVHARGARRARSSAAARSRPPTPTSARRRSVGSATPRSPARTPSRC